MNPNNIFPTKTCQTSVALYNSNQAPHTGTLTRINEYLYPRDSRRTPPSKLPISSNISPKLPMHYQDKGLCNLIV